MKKNKVLVLIVCLVVAVVLGFGAYFSGNWLTSEKNSVKIGIVLYNINDTFLSGMMTEFDEIAREHEQLTGIQIDINLVGSMESQATQNSQVERFISLGYDVLVVNLVDRTSASHIINRAMDANIPIVFFNREPVQGDLNKWDHLFYVGSDARTSAELEAQIIIDRYNEDPRSIDLNGDGVIQYVMLEGERRHQDAIIRTEFSVQALRDAGLEVEKIAGNVANWDLSQARAITEKIMLEQGDEIEVIICNNDDMALGAAKAMEDLGLDFSNIVGIDGTEAGVAAVDSGKLLGTVKVDVYKHAKAIFDIAFALAMEKDVYSEIIWEIEEDKSVRVPMEIYTKTTD